MTIASADVRLRAPGPRSIGRSAARAVRAVPARRRAALTAPCDSPATCSVLPMSANRGPGPATGIAIMLSPAALCGLLLLLA